MNNIYIYIYVCVCVYIYLFIYYLYFLRVYLSLDILQKLLHIFIGKTINDRVFLSNTSSNSYNICIYSMIIFGSNKLSTAKR